MPKFPHFLKANAPEAAAAVRRVVVLAGGRGTRLSPRTDRINKHLLDVAGRPMIAWVLDRAARAGLTEACVVTNAEHVADFEKALGAAAELGLASLTYVAQPSVGGGVADALDAARVWAGEDTDHAPRDRFVCLLGDNLFGEPDALAGFVQRFAVQPAGNARLLTGPARAPMQIGAMGVARFDPQTHKLCDIDEKPADATRDAHAVLGVYGYPVTVFDELRAVTPGPRGERDITDLNRRLLAQDRVDHERIESDWMDAGTHDTLAAAGLMLS